MAALESSQTIIRSPVEELAASWQARILRDTCGMRGLGVVAPKRTMGAVVLSIFGHSLDAALAVLLAGVFPGFYSIGTPFVCSAAMIDQAGRIVADVVAADNEAPRKAFPLFSSLRRYETELRRLADRCRLSDEDRLRLFLAGKAWIVADRRLDPTMDPADPDARRRFTVH